MFNTDTTYGLSIGSLIGFAFFLVISAYNGKVIDSMESVNCTPGVHRCNANNIEICKEFKNKFIWLPSAECPQGTTCIPDAPECLSNYLLDNIE